MGPGALWYGKTLYQIEQTLLPLLPDAAALVANRTGATLELEVIPVVPAPELHVPGESCDQVANQAGIIESCVALEGVSQVAAGQSVTAGQVLISGRIEHKDGSIRTVEARGAVLAQISLTGEALSSLYTDVPEPSGDPYTVRTLYLANAKMPLSPKPPEGEAVLLSTQTQYLGQLYLPAKIILETYQPVTVTTQTRTYQQAEALGVEQAREKAKAQLLEGETVAKETVQTQSTEDGKGVVCYVTLQVVRNIATPAPIRMQNEGGTP